MQILWGALRAVSVETIGVVVVFWMLHGAAGLAFDAPWRAWKSRQVKNERSDETNTQIARVKPQWVGNVATDVAPEETACDEAQRPSLQQWLDTLFPASLHESSQQPASEQRSEYTRERLDHYSRLYGIASRDYKRQHRVADDHVAK